MLGKVTWYTHILQNAERISGMQVFLEEVIVRRELSDNFCHHSPQSYDNFDGCPSWARVSYVPVRSVPIAAQQLTHAPFPG